MMKLKLQKEIDRINRFERKWKIMTSKEKFKITPIAQYKTEQITINSNNIDKSKDGKFLGLKLQTTGLLGYITSMVFHKE